MSLIATLELISSLDELDDLVQGDAWRDYLAALAKRPEDAEVEQFRLAVANAKSRLSPEHSCEELKSLKDQVYAGSPDPEELRPVLARIAGLRAALPLRRHERLFGRIENAIGQAFSGALSGAGYSNRARRARDLFTEHAGRTRIEGAATDSYGNAAGTAYDLGRDGAFSGHAVHVLHFYAGEHFDFKLPTAAFGRKGFKVERRTKPGSPDELRKWLQDARQLWVISTHAPLLGPAHVEVIRDFWRRGGALYIWGDNQPFYADANVLLQALFGPDLTMTGNVPGGKVVHEISPPVERGEPQRVNARRRSLRGFQPHLVTTGLEHLFEGITVASFVEDVAGRYAFAPLLYGSDGNLITVVREPTPESGAVMADGAFTRLYCQWDEAGSARYVCNAACFLAAMTMPEDEDAGEEAPGEQEVLPFDPQGAFQGVCDLTGKPSSTWLVMSVEQMGDALRNTSDMVLTDPLCAGEQNCIFSDKLYDERIGPWIVSEGADPFTRRPVVECLPLIDLAVKRNLHEFTTLLCKCLMGGKYLPTAARKVFFAVVDQMLEPSRAMAHRDAWEYLYRQCLDNFTSTPEFTEMGSRMPLLDAMAAYFSPATDEMVQVRKSFATLGVIGRTLLREGRTPRGQVRAVARHALVKSLVADAVGEEKGSSGTIRPLLEGLLYDNFHGIPKLNGGRVVKHRPEFLRDISRDRARLESHFESPLLTAEDQTVVLHALLTIDPRQYTAESAVGRLLEESSPFRAVWRGEKRPDVLELLNERFSDYREGIDWSDPHLSQAPPFATTYGPSVYRCVCGHAFGDPAEELTDETLLALGLERQKHFRAVYRSTGQNWYPGAGTLHYNLHRAVQRVVKEQHPESMQFEEPMVAAVAGYLKCDGKGFLGDPLLWKFVRSVLESYLELRRAGQPHPEGVLTLRVKAERERQVLLGCAGGRLVSFAE